MSPFFKIFVFLCYRQQSLRSTNPGSPKPGNCFELLSDWLLSYWESQLEGCSKPIKSRALGVWGFVLLKNFHLSCEALHFKNNFFCAWNYLSNKSKMRSPQLINYEPVYLSSEKPIFYMKAIQGNLALCEICNGFQWEKSAKDFCNF